MAKRPGVLFLVKVVVSASLVWWILSRAELADIFAVVSLANAPLILGALSLNLIGYTTSTTRWQGLLAARGYRISWWYLVRAHLVALFFSNFLPSTIGGDAARAHDSWRAGVRRSEAVAVLVADRATGVTALALFALAGFVGSPRARDAIPGLPWLVAGSVAAGLAGLWVLQELLNRTATTRAIRSPPLRWIHAAIDSTLRAILAFRRQPMALLRALLWSVALQANVVLFHFLVGSALGLEIPLIDYFVIIPLALIVMMVPITINGIGLRENVYAGLMAFYGVSGAAAVAFAWVVYGNTLLQAVIGGLTYALRK